MIQPDRTLVDAADLMALTDVTARLIRGAFPTPEWEVTDEMRRQFYRYDPEVTDDDEVERRLRALHREGLL